MGRVPRQCAGLRLSKSFQYGPPLAYGAVPCTKCLQPERIVPIGRTVCTMKGYLTEYEERAGEFGCLKPTHFDENESVPRFYRREQKKCVPLQNASLCVLAPQPAVTQAKIQALLAGGERRSDKCVSATSSSTKAGICLVSVRSDPRPEDFILNALQIDLATCLKIKISC